jgi:NADH-quinone oxidoreductase subunit G
LQAQVQQVALDLQKVDSPAHQLTAVQDELTRLSYWPIYRTDAMVRRASALQETQFILDADLLSIRVNQHTADCLQLQAGDNVVATIADSQLTQVLKIDNRLANNMVLIPYGLDETAGFGGIETKVQLVRA